MNWNSSTQSYSDVVSTRVNTLKKEVNHDRYFHRMDVKTIAKRYNLSVSRIYELLK